MKYTPIINIKLSSFFVAIVSEKIIARNCLGPFGLRRLDFKLTLIMDCPSLPWTAINVSVQLPINVRKHPILSPKDPQWPFNMPLNVHCYYKVIWIDVSKIPKSLGQHSLLPRIHNYAISCFRGTQAIYHLSSEIINYAQS